MDEPRSARAAAVTPLGRGRNVAPAWCQSFTTMDDRRTATTDAERRAPSARRPAVTGGAIEAQRSASIEAREAVIVVHGLWMPGWETLFLRRRFEAAGYRAYVFAYSTVGVGLDANADRLAAFADRVPGRRLHFVGHSLGGVLILKLFERHRVPRASRIVCLGSPLVGTHAGRTLGTSRFGRAVVGRCIQDLLANGGCRTWAGACELGIIAGDVPLGFGRLLGRLPKPNDGTVAVEETRLAGATEHLVLHCTHFSLLWSPGAAEHVIRFLKAGRFAGTARRG